MPDTHGKMSTNTMMTAAGAVGVLLFIILLIAGVGFFGSLLIGLIIAAVVYLLLHYAVLGVLPKLPGAETGPAADDPDSRSAAAAASTFGGPVPVAEPSTPPANDPEADEPANRDAPGDGTAATEARPDADAKAAPPAPGASAVEATPRAEPAAEPATADEGDGTKPSLMSSPRSGGPDDLKRIKGVGPKLEQKLHEIGVYHFDQIAAWGPEEVQWMDDNLVGFKGRVSRDEWVAQARELAREG